MPAAKPEKRHFLVHFEPSFIWRTTILAVTRGMTASVVVQQALAGLIDRIAEEPEHPTASREGRS